jgi:hypothetical protein
MTLFNLPHPSRVGKSPLLVLGGLDDDSGGVPTPVIDGLVSIGSVVCREDYWQTGRTLSKLGLASLDKAGILAVAAG